MEYAKAINKAELPINEMRIVSIRGKNILLVNANGSYYAINNQCTHLGGSLGKGKLNGTSITCPKHGAVFDVKTGKNVDDAKIVFIRMKVKDEETYPIKIEGDDILVGVS
jgi:3-phenylpropionate/trans-cinnamate dioxygenase ferredoxin subunit